MSCDSFLSLATPGIQNLRPYQPGKPVAELEREYGITHAIKLASNENPLGPGSQVVEVLRAACDSELGRYPDGNGFGLKQALANRHQVEPSMLTLGNGSNDVLDLIARAFVEAGQGIAFCQHAFAVYPIATQAVNGVAQVIPVLANYDYDLQAISDTINDQTKVFFIANPNNPTGNSLNSTQLRTMLDNIPDNVIVVVDQAYLEYAGDFPDAGEWLADYPNLIVTYTFSKAFGLAGLRVGYALSSAEIADVLNRVRQPFNVNSLALLAAETALQDGTHLQHSLNLNQSGMSLYEHAFTQMDLSWIPSAGNFITVDVGGDAAPVYASLLKLGVIVRPIANYGLPQHLRISIGLETENQTCINALQTVLNA